MNRLSPNSMDIRRIRPTDLELFVRKSGFEVIKTNFTTYKLIKSPADKEGNRIELVYPTNKNASDYYLRVSEFINGLAVVLDQEPSLVARRIAGLESDIILVRLMEPQVVNETITLELAEKVISGLYDLLKYGADLVEDIKPYIIKPHTKSIEYANSCRFAHTFQGSFGITVESPFVLPTIGMDIVTPEKPFERKVVEKVFKGLTLAEIATAENSVDFLLDNFTDGFNANMCESIVRMAEGLNIFDVEYHAEWSPLIPVDSTRGIKQIVKLQHRSMNILSDAAKYLRKVEDEKPIDIMGYITVLKAPIGFFKDIESERQIVLDGITREGEKLRITAQLGIEDYLSACTAHKEGLEAKLTGTIKKIGKKWILTSYTDFHVIK